MVTKVVNVRDYKPYSKYWTNPPTNPYVYIGRAVQYYGKVIIPFESKWYNPKPIKNSNDMAERLEAIRYYKEDYFPNSGLINQIHELKDKILGCWYKPDPCHGDFLVELANSNELNLTN